MKRVAFIAAGLFLFAPFAFANAASISVQSILPGASVLANNQLTFSVVASGFFPQTYRASDSFTNSSFAVSDINPSGNVSWAPLPSDAGTHTLTITALDEAGDSATITQTFTVLPPPSVSIASVSPGSVVMPGTMLSFSVLATGFTNPAYTMGDEFGGGSSVADSDITPSGNFSWTPDISQDGQHTITVYASDSLGHSASASEAVRVGAGPALLAQVTSSSTSVYPGQPVSLIVSGNNFSPTTYGVSDSFPNTTVIAGYITSSGSFAWTPQQSDVGTHVLTFTGTIGNYGQSATTSTTITVLGTASAPASVPAAAPTVVATPAAPVVSSPAFVFSTYLYPGLQSDDVMHLQTILSQLGYFSSASTGYYGPLTTAAVEKFQAAHGFDQLGVVGPATRAALNALQSPTSSTATSSASDGYQFKNFMGFGEDTTDGPDVAELQKRLAGQGLFSGAQTGYFGSATQAAVEQFQTAHGIAATGFVGSQTRAALNQ